MTRTAELLRSEKDGCCFAAVGKVLFQNRRARQPLYETAFDVATIMAKRHLPRGAVRDIGSERITILLRLSQEAVRAGRDDRARRYVGLARAIGMKAQVPLPPEFRYCEKCFLPLMPGINCTVRLTGHKVVCGCRGCGAVRRRPYLKEQKEND